MELVDGSYLLVRVEFICDSVLVRVKWIVVLVKLMKLVISS